LGAADELRVIRAPVFGRAYSAAPTRFHAHLNQLLRKLGSEGRKYFDFKSDVVLTELTDLRDIWTAKEAEAFAIKYWEIIADSLSKPVGVGAASQRSIPTGEQSGLPMRIATTGGGPCNEKKLSYREWERAWQQANGGRST
jgi:hypothetical protein